MDQSKNLCVLVVEVVGRQRLVDALGTTETEHAIERCMNRIERAIGANSGRVRRKEDDRICVAFERCDAAALAATEMLERVQSLPPLRGLRMAVRVGVHYGAAGAAGSPTDDAERIATRLAAAARRGQALASGAAVTLLSPAVRHLAAPETTNLPELDRLEWPVFSLGSQGAGAAPPAPAVAARMTKRLRIRYQQEVMFVEELRPVLLLGRELGNDVVIMDPRASRQHCRIERRREGFVLIDQSSNGSYVLEDGRPERCVRQDELLLVGPGRIGCGFSTSEVERDQVYFELV